MAGPSLVELLATIPDPRKPRGRIHPLSAVLSLAVLAMLAGMKSLEAIAQYCWAFCPCKANSSAAMPCSLTATLPRPSAMAAAIICYSSRTTSPNGRLKSKPRCTTTRPFPPYQQRQKQAAEQEARTIDKGHGRREYRRLSSTTALNDYLDWPDVGQVFELERVRVMGGKTSVEVVHGITSVGRERGDAVWLLRRTRGPWGVENNLHWVRDGTLGEEACRVRTGSAAQVLAAMRNAVVHLLEGVKAASKAAAIRSFAARPFAALPLLFT